MSTIVTRAGKGSMLTNTEMDTNLNNLNNDKLEASDLATIEADIIALENTKASTGKAIAMAMVFG